MAKLNEKISSDKELGPGFRIGHSYFVPSDGDVPSEDWYRHIVDTQIAPLLREYWFDAAEDVERGSSKPHRRRPTLKNIPILNVYYLLCYAWGRVQERDTRRLAKLGGLSTIQDLLGKVLAGGVSATSSATASTAATWNGARIVAGIRGKLAVSETAKRGAPRARPGRLRLRGVVRRHSAEPDPTHIAVRTAGGRRVKLAPTTVRSDVRSAYRRLDGVSRTRLASNTFGQVPTRGQPAALPVPPLGVQAPVRELGGRREDRAHIFPRLSPRMKQPCGHFSRSSSQGSTSGSSVRV